MRSRRLPWLVLLVFFLGACTTETHAPPPQPDGHGRPIWLATQAALRDLLADPTVHAGLARDQVYELLGARQQPTRELPVTAVRSFASESAVRAAANEGGTDASSDYVLYDPEAWSHTPRSEQRDPVAAMRRVAAAVRQQKRRLILAPALNLTTVLAPESHKPRWQEFLDLKLPAAAARESDVVELQAQSLAREPSTYARFVAAATAQARAANPRVTILAGISSNPPGSPVSSDHLRQSILKTRNIVDGYWVNIPQPGSKCPGCNPRRPDIAVAALRSVL